MISSLGTASLPIVLQYRFWSLTAYSGASPPMTRRLSERWNGCGEHEQTTSFSLGLLFGGLIITPGSIAICVHGSAVSWKTSASSSSTFGPEWGRGRAGVFRGLL